MRAFAWFVGVIVLAGVIAALIAYPVYELTTNFANFAFHRVASRIAMLALVLELVWLCRRLGLNTRRDFGYGLPWRKFIAGSALWGVIGAATAALGAGFLLGTGLRVPDPDFSATGAAVAKAALTALSSGIAVALLEETVIRGAMHTAIERESGAWTAALLTAPLFAVLHFFAKTRIPPAELQYGSGFDLLSRSFAPLADFGAVYDAFLSWLLVGLILSFTRVVTGNIAVAIGLHAGWVVVLRLLQLTTVAAPAPRYAGWVGHFDGLLGLWLVPWSSAILAGLWATRRRWAPAIRSV